MYRRRAWSRKNLRICAYDFPSHPPRYYILSFQRCIVLFKKETMRRVGENLQHDDIKRFNKQRNICAAREMYHFIVTICRRTHEIYRHIWSSHSVKIGNASTRFFSISFRRVTIATRAAPADYCGRRSMTAIMSGYYIRIGGRFSWQGVGADKGLLGDAFGISSTSRADH